MLITITETQVRSLPTEIACAIIDGEEHDATAAQLAEAGTEHASRADALSEIAGHGGWLVDEDGHTQWIAPSLTIGDRVHGGDGEDYDEGRIVELDGDQALIAWSDGVTSTWTPLSVIERA